MRFKRRHSEPPEPERDEIAHRLIGEFDAAVWAHEFVALAERKPEIATDEGAMFGWFANAIMAGYDHAKNKAREAG